MTTNASRIPVDYDGYEPDQQQPAERPSQAKSNQARSDQAKGDQARSDPLAELARIVGQDDPFRALLAAKDSRRAGGPEGGGGRVEPQLPDYAGAPAEPAPGPSMDAFNQYLSAVQRESVPEPDPAPEPQPEPLDEPAGEVAPERPRGRSRLALVGTALGIVAVAVGGALTWKALHPHRGSGTPIVVMADQAPLKIAPQNAGGVEIPDQNKQIYERNAKDGQIKIVNREEQPLDVKQAARALTSEAPTAGTPGPAPGAPVNLLTESLGEPRRVRTVSVRPEPPPVEAQRAAQGTQGGPAPARPEAAPIPTMTLPEATPAAATPRSASRSIQAATTPAPAPAPEPQAPDTVASTTVAAPKSNPAPQRVASAEPPPAKPTPAATPDAQAPVGGFSVQLSVRATEKEARAAFAQAQERYHAELAGQSALIRQAEVNGKTIFRVRVGPMSKESANSLCSKLQASGGTCFVAKN
ncbi:SPOR domain-containing protein [Methylobacterium nodulans]|uniref:Sporulation domain protein n=1 Tax=Methylobacterium nodulans (strain LMG 21967 / CNCM I-2342 / ORS 2060) TaxID=460265 RepID=B8I9T3_METNO|nr:SPOR domain-containing protein [Methylobacterium nodulans]ACL57161.1 Sporulation domain protein [Methylobacterium nodulans ORS 2060]